MAGCNFPSYELTSSANSCTVQPTGKHVKHMYKRGISLLKEPCSIADSDIWSFSGHERTWSADF